MCGRIQGSKKRERENLAVVSVLSYWVDCPVQRLFHLVYFVRERCVKIKDKKRIFER